MMPHAARTFLHSLLVIHSFSSISCGASSTLTDVASYSPLDVIRRDVVVIGGGSTGTYSSIRLRDHNKTVVMVEKKAELGGHAEVWTDPNSGTTVDIGVVVFSHSDTVADYFARFNLSLVPIGSKGTSEYVDFATGQIVNPTATNGTALATALSAYLDQLNKYPGLQGGFNITYPVNPDLLLSFQDFVVKYSLEDLVSTTFLTNQGMAPLLNVSMLYVFKYFNAEEVDSLYQGFLTVANYSTTELYHRAAELLDADVFFNSTVLSMDRSQPEEVRVAIQTSGGPKLLIGKKLLSTIPPMLDNLGGYDLSDAETSLFGQFFANGYYAGIINNTSIDTGLLASGIGQSYNVPSLPGIYAAYPLGGGLAQLYYGSTTPLADEEVQTNVVASIQLYQNANGLPSSQPDWVKYSSHAPFNLMVSNEAIADGFYDKLYTLQGARKTFYNGAAWHTQDSSALWKFTDDYLLPILLESLEETK